MSSYQDPSTPDHNGPSHNNQTSGLKNSCVADNSSVSPESVTPVDDQGIEIDSQNELGVDDMKVSKSPVGIVMVGQVLCLNSQKPKKHTSYLEDVDKLLIPIANSLENIDVNNDDESRILLDKEDVEDMGDQFDTATHCCTENSFQTENEQTENDDAVCNKNIDQGIELNSQNERLDVVEENRKGMGLDYLENFPPLINHNRREISSDVAVMFGTIISYNSDVNDNDDELKTENEQTGNCDRKGISVASSEGCGIETVKKPLNFLVKIPRFDDEVLRERIRLSKLHVDEKAGLRDSILVLIKEKRANNRIHGLNYESAKTEVRCARNLMKSKYMEIDYLQSVINRARTASSIDDINSKISNMDYRMQHNTITLKEEKQLLQEIKQLKQAREQMSSNIGSQDEIKQAVQQREEAEERLKTLRKDLNILKTGVSKAEATATEAMKKYHDEKQMLMKLEAQFRATDKVQQEAYKKLRSLRELSEKEEQFFKYKKDAGVANNYALNKDTMALHSFCSNQVENFMNLWNKNEEYRREYARNNARSTVRRFGTLDGRALGHGERPPILPNMRVSRVVSATVKAVPAPQIPSVKVKQETTGGNVNLGGKSTNEVTTSKNISKDEIESLRKEEQVTMEKDEAKLKEQHWAEEMAKANEAFKRKKTVEADLASQILSVILKQETTNENVTLGGVSTNEATESKNISKGTKNAVDGETLQSKDDFESSRKEEEVTMEEDEAKLKEQRRAEEMAKADEAFKRKRREEKKQRREELKALKEAEQREKKREKRRRKKEQKEADSVHSNGESGAICEDAEDIQAKELPSVAPQKPCLDAKKCKAKPIPVLLRKRKKRGVQQWMWVGITSFIFLVLFLVGEYRRIPM